MAAAPVKKVQKAASSPVEIPQVNQRQVQRSLTIAFSPMDVVAASPKGAASLIARRSKTEADLSNFSGSSPSDDMMISSPAVESPMLSMPVRKVTAAPQSSFHKGKGSFPRSISASSASASPSLSSAATPTSNASPQLQQKKAVRFDAGSKGASEGEASKRQSANSAALDSTSAPSNSSSNFFRDNDNSAEDSPAVDWDETTIVTHLLKALNLREKGDAVAYLGILEMLDPSSQRNESLNTESLMKWIGSLSSIISNLNQNLAPLVDAVLSQEWLSRGTEFRTAYRNFLENLVSAHSYYMMPVVTMLIESLVPDAESNLTQAELAESFDYVHDVLRRVLSLVPSSPSLMVPVITENFPQKDDDMKTLMWYLKNVLEILKYAPVLRDSIWALIIDRAIQIDVEIQAEMNKLDEDVYEEALARCEEGSQEDIEKLDRQLQFDFDDPDLEDDSHSDQGGSALRRTALADFANLTSKLDLFLHIVICSVQEQFTLTANNPLQRSDFSALLLRLFDRTILPTHNCRFTQFIWFYACSLDPTFTDSFLVNNLQKVLDNSSPSVIRVYSNSFVASFLARSAFVDRQSLLHSVQVLTDWARTYVIAKESEICGKPDQKRHVVFYSVVQTLLYVFCFKWKQLVIPPDENVAISQFPDQMNGFTMILNSKFTPLKICKRDVVAEFARITHKLDIMYCYNLYIRSNSANSGAIASSAASGAPNGKPQASAAQVPVTTSTLTRRSGIAVPMNNGATQSQRNPTAVEVHAVGSSAYQQIVKKVQPRREEDSGSLLVDDVEVPQFPFDPVPIMKIITERVRTIYTVYDNGDEDEGEEEEDGDEVGGDGGDRDETDFMATSFSL